jgi:hypothetical protein
MVAASFLPSQLLVKHEVGRLLRSGARFFLCPLLSMPASFYARFFLCPLLSMPASFYARFFLCPLLSMLASLRLLPWKLDHSSKPRAKLESCECRFST